MFLVQNEKRDSAQFSFIILPHGIMIKIIYVGTGLKPVRKIIQNILFLAQVYEKENFNY